MRRELCNIGCCEEWIPETPEEIADDLFKKSEKERLERLDREMKEGAKLAAEQAAREAYRNRYGRYPGE